MRCAQACIMALAAHEQQSQASNCAKGKAHIARQDPLTRERVQLLTRLRRFFLPATGWAVGLSATFWIDTAASSSMWGIPTGTRPTWPATRRANSLCDRGVVLVHTEV